MNRFKDDIKQGELYLVNFNPSAGHEFQGKRPALVIESDVQIKKTNLISIIPLTSNIGNKISDDIFISKDNNNKLISDSIIKVYYICSFDYYRFINKIGKVDEEILEKIKIYLKKHFDL